VLLSNERYEGLVKHDLRETVGLEKHGRLVEVSFVFTVWVPSNCMRKLGLYDDHDEKTKSKLTMIRKSV
jgi:hypothetical protein